MLRLVLVVVLSLSVLAPAQERGAALDAPDGGQAVVVMHQQQPLVVHVADRPVADVTPRTAPDALPVAVTWRELEGRTWVDRYALSLDGVTFTEPRDAAYELMLRHGPFDPLTEAAPDLPAHLASPAWGRLFVVQYWTQGLEAWRDALRGMGARVRLFLAWHANVIDVAPDAVAEIEALPFVRAVVPFHPAYKLEPELLAEVAGGPVDRPRRRVNILTVARGEAIHAVVRDWIRAFGGTVDAPGGDSYLMSATLTPRQILQVAATDEVQWIDRWSEPEDDMDLARQFHGADYAVTVGNYRGQGTNVEVMDGGCDEIHPDLQNFTVHTTNTPSAHGTATSGIVCGSGANNTAATGMMPDAHLVIADYNYIAGGSRHAHTGQLVNPSFGYECVLQSNSWGNTRTTAYNSISQDMDTILFDYQRISILQSQSNAGNQDSRPQAWAKNIISVGGIRHYNTLSESDDAWAGGASIGPAADGRIKPDIASFYDSTLCTDQVGSAGYSSTNYYASFGGTSGATPIVAGALGLLYQMWSDGTFGNPTSGGSVFDERPNNTTMKALLLNTARQWNFSGTNHDLTRMHQGWGRPDLQYAWDNRTAFYIVDETDVLTNLSSTVHSVNVNGGTPELRVTMVYRDPAGTTSSTLHRINDLDLEVTAPGGTVYRGNNGLAAGTSSTAGGSANNVDTVECVIIPSPAAGTWQVKVIASELNQDSHVETGALDADYALVVSGVAPAPLTPPDPPAALSASAPASNQVDLTWADQSNDEDGFDIERSLDGVSFSPLASTGANSTAYTDGTTQPTTPYWYRVRAHNTAGSSAWSNVAMVTTPATAPVDSVANGEATAQGSVTSGNYTDTWSNDGVAESITEEETNGKPSNRYSRLLHKWTFNAPGGTAVDLHLKAWHSVSVDGDDFTFQWSTDDSTYTDIVTVTSTTAPGVLGTYPLPANLSGNVWIRVIDTDHTPGNRTLDTVNVDTMFLRTTGTGGTLPPAAPTGAAVTTVSSTELQLSWADNSGNEDGFDIERSPDGTSWSALITVGADVTSYNDTGLTASTIYHYRVRAFNTAGSSGWDSASGMTGSIGGPTDDVASGETAIAGSVTGTFTDTHGDDAVSQDVKEITTGGHPSTRISYLEHRWNVNVTGGSSVTFFLNAWKTDANDNDVFVFSYSTNGTDFTDMVTVSNTSDAGYQSFSLPAATSGAVWIRVVDSDQTPGNRGRDTIHVDHMYIRSQ